MMVAVGIGELCMEARQRVLLFALTSGQTGRDQREDQGHNLGWCPFSCRISVLTLNAHCAQIESRVYLYYRPNTEN